MYLPSTLLHLLQIPLSAPSSHSSRESFAVLSPYHDAPSVPGVSPNLPDDCTVNQVIMVSSFPRI